MAEITAATVVKLRKISGQSMGECKKALEEANGDMDKATEILRKKGLATLAKRAERETTEGAVVLWQSPDGKTAAMATLCCETDFVSKSDDFVAMAKDLREYIAVAPAQPGAATVLRTAVNGKASKSADRRRQQDRREDAGRRLHPVHARRPGLIGVYVHFNKKVGSMILIETDSDKTAQSPAIQAAAADFAMHITASKPIALDPSSIDPAVIEKEKAIYAEQVKGKPAAVVERIVDGKLKKFYSDFCLVLQPFVKDDTKSVEQVLAEAAKQAGGKATIKQFVRFEVG
jgi:elongation factor Ts